MPSPVSLSVPAVSAVVPPQLQLEPQLPPFEVVLERLLRQGGAAIEKQEVTLDALVRDATRGRDFSNAELLALQVKVSRYSLEMELLSKLVQQAVQGLQQLLRTQV